MAALARVSEMKYNEAEYKMYADAFHGQDLTTLELLYCVLGFDKCTAILKEIKRRRKFAAIWRAFVIFGTICIIGSFFVG